MASRMSPRDVESRRQEGCERWGRDRAAGRKKTCGRWQNWESRNDENPGKWTNEPERGQMGSMRNALFKFRLGRESIVERGLTR